MRLAAAALATLVASPACAGALADGLRDSAGECVAMATVRALEKHSVALNAAQFQFVRGFYMAAPPMSTELPVGDRAEIVTDGEDFAVVLIDSDADVACARFHVNDVAAFLTLINAVGAGATVRAKDAAGKGA